MSETYLSPLISADGDMLAVQDWPLPSESDFEFDSQLGQRGTVLIVHGLGEHAARYSRLADDLNSWGYNVRSYDQYGHGDSGGVRGSLPHAMRLLDDLADVIDSTRARMDASEPLILLGHSMGGLVTTQLVLHKIRHVDALVLSSPAFDPGLGAVQKLLLGVLPRIAPQLRVGNGLQPKYLCRDKAVVAAYQADPLVHNRISASLAQWIAQMGPQCIAAAAQWAVPTLLLYAGADRLVSPAGSRAFAAAAPAKLLQSHCFEAMYHEILNDPQRAQVLTVLRHWLHNLQRT
jgi:alpha-beta hydrolase superfamily lysophospholipase